MGDGRYYTVNQFTSVVFLTVIIIVMIITVMLSMYKSSGGRISRRLIALNITFSCVAILDFTEAMIVNESSGYVVRLISSLLCMGLNVLMISLHLALLKKWIKKPLASVSYVLYGAFGLLALALLINKSWLLVSYGFDKVVYGSPYIIGMFISHLILGGLWFLTLWHGRRVVEHKTRNQMACVIILLFWYFPMSLYILRLVALKLQINSTSYVFYLFSAIGLVLLYQVFKPFRLRTTIFSDVRDLIQDYVLIIDDKGAIIYRNNRVSTSEIFRPIKTLRLEALGELFNGAIQIREAYNKEFIKHLGNESRYFSYSHKRIGDATKSEGNIITLTDITSLMDMLDELKKKQVATAKTNKDLFHYKEVVYELEKEKEINNLLDEIAANQQQSMTALKADIQRMSGSQEQYFIDEVTKLIGSAKKNLQDVRSAVTAYMHYYGGNND